MNILYETVGNYPATKLHSCLSQFVIVELGEPKLLRYPVGREVAVNKLVTGETRIMLCR